MKGPLVEVKLERYPVGKHSLHRIEVEYSQAGVECKAEVNEAR